MDVVCNKHSLPCRLKERVPDMDSFYYECPLDCLFVVSGPQLYRAEKKEKESGL